ncbi:oleate hydratase [Bdellovibrio sp. HCB337]|uniref:oleate hydratase n=1 Tax=Bdellovibrio sp. HCB337 TaxID=3394358 RepID=UPI0039A6B7A3
MAEQKAYLVGSGIASLASAAYLLREGGFKGENIFILEEMETTGGSLDGGGDPDKGYIMRGGRMLNFSYVCTYELLSFIPSLQDPDKTVLDEIQEFNSRVKTHSHCRLVLDGQNADASSMGFSYKDRFDILEMMMKSEDSLGTRRIEDCFEKDFFETNFWYMWASMFAFQPWHSAIEFKRYLHRFIHEFPRINTLEGVDRTPYNQYESIVLPIVQWLKNHGVHFVMDTEVYDLSFQEQGKLKYVSHIHYRRGEDTNAITVEGDDLVFVTNGSMTAGSSLGSMKSAPLLKNKKEDGAWALWESIAVNRPELGRPENFDNRIDESKWLSFTCTLKDPLFFSLMEKFTGNVAGTGGLVTIMDSNWLMSVVLAHQPHFLNQPPDVQVFWGYGLFIDNPGNYVAKKMYECTGQEILEELCFHLGLMEELPEIQKTANCIPCMMPFITSQFLTRAPGDRPDVVPENYANLAFVSQFCEIPDDVVFTVEYSVRAAQTAVYKLLHLEKTPPPVYSGESDFKVLFNSLRTMFRTEERGPAKEEHRPSH